MGFWLRFCNNYDKKGGVEFAGYKVVDGRYVPVNFVLDKSHVDLINECQSIAEIYECYKRRQSLMCSFDKDGFCHALVCYSLESCGARDENGNPKYADLDNVREAD